MTITKYILSNFRLLLIHYASTTIYRDVTNDNGLTVFKLDTVRIKLGYERIIKKISISSIELNINHIEKIAKSFTIKDHLHETLSRKITTAREKLTSLQPHRQKRGLINALGTVVKYIAGNPDQEDLEIIQHSLGTLQNQENKLVNNQMRQIKINNSFQDRINNVTNTIRKISSQISALSNTLREDATLEQLNLIFSIDNLIHALEDIEEQVEFSKQDLINKNILSLEDKKYIYQRLVHQNLKLNFIDEIFQFSSGSLTISKDNIVILVKIPILEDNPYELLQIETININKTKISTDVKLVARRHQRIIPQRHICQICEKSTPLEDECIYRILTHQKPRCQIQETDEMPSIKEIRRGIILIDTTANIEVFSSCGDSRILSNPTVIETENCTVNILNYTFHGENQFAPQEEYLVPTYNKQPELAQNAYEETEDIKINNLEYLKETQLIINRHQKITIVGGAIFITALIITSILFLATNIRKRRILQVQVKGESPREDSKDSDNGSTEEELKGISFSKLLTFSSPKGQPRTVNSLRGEELWNIEPATPVATVPNPQPTW